MSNTRHGTPVLFWQQRDNPTILQTKKSTEHFPENWHDVSRNYRIYKRSNTNAFDSEAYQKMGPANVKTRTQYVMPDYMYYHLNRPTCLVGVDQKTSKILLALTFHMITPIQGVIHLPSTQRDRLERLLKRILALKDGALKCGVPLKDDAWEGWKFRVPTDAVLKNPADFDDAYKTMPYSLTFLPYKGYRAIPLAGSKMLYKRTRPKLWKRSLVPPGPRKKYKGLVLPHRIVQQFDNFNSTNSGRTVSNRPNNNSSVKSRSRSKSKSPTTYSKLNEAPLPLLMEHLPSWNMNIHNGLFADDINNNNSWARGLRRIGNNSNSNSRKKKNT